jgi:hypothetical protein
LGGNGISYFLCVLARSISAKLLCVLDNTGVSGDRRIAFVAIRQFTEPTGRCVLTRALQPENLGALHDGIERVGVLLHHLSTLR